MSSHAFDKARWQRQDILNQMGNIGSEVGRAFNALDKGEEGSMKGAFYRGLDLLDACVEGLVAQKSPRTKEVLRAREQFAAAIIADRSDRSLENYFMEFALAARWRNT